MPNITLTDPVAGTVVASGLIATNNGNLRTLLNSGLDPVNLKGNPALTTGEVPVWNGAQFVRSSVTNIGPSSLGSGSPSSANFLRGDGTWASAGVKTTTSTLAGGPPGSPADGDIWIATAVDGNGVRWAFQYNAGSASSFKWEFIGGSAVLLSVGTHAVLNTMTQVGATGWWYPAGVGFTAARAGDYDVMGQVSLDPNGTSTTGLVDSFWGTTLTTAGAAELVFSVAGAGNNITGSPITKMTGVTAASTIGIAATSGATATTKWDQGWIRIQPIRIA